jgi:hypothetical protein
MTTIPQNHTICITIGECNLIIYLALELASSGKRNLRKRTKYINTFVKIIEDIEKSDYACLESLKETLLKDCRKELDKLYEADRNLNKFIEDNVIKL